MEKCKVEFSGNNQKLIVDMELLDNGDLEYHVSTEPKIDNKTNLGLAGKMCEIFLTSLLEKDNKNEKSDNTKN